MLKLKETDQLTQEQKVIIQFMLDNLMFEGVTNEGKTSITIENRAEATFSNKPLRVIFETEVQELLYETEVFDLQVITKDVLLENKYPLGVWLYGETEDEKFIFKADSFYYEMTAGLGNQYSFSELHNNHGCSEHNGMLYERCIKRIATKQDIENIKKVNENVEV